MVQGNQAVPKALQVACPQDPCPCDHSLLTKPHCPCQAEQLLLNIRLTGFCHDPDRGPRKPTALRCLPCHAPDSMNPPPDVGRVFGALTTHQPEPGQTVLCECLSRLRRQCCSILCCSLLLSSSSTHRSGRTEWLGQACLVFGFSRSFQSNNDNGGGAILAGQLLAAHQCCLSMLPVDLCLVGLFWFHCLQLYAYLSSVDHNWQSFDLDALHSKNHILVSGNDEFEPSCTAEYGHKRTPLWVMHILCPIVSCPESSTFAPRSSACMTSSCNHRLKDGPMLLLNGSV